MNKFIEKELMKCRVPLDSWSSTTLHLTVPLEGKVKQSLTKSQVTIDIKKYIINEPPNFTLSATWNKGTVPPERNMIVDIVDNRGKMIKVEGKGVTTGISWSGWLPQKGFEIL